jgi:hypothetical protein
VAESAIGLYKTELIRMRGPWRNIDDVELATLTYVDWFNNRRLHGTIGDIPPAELEAVYYAATAIDDAPIASAPRTGANTGPSEALSAIETTSRVAGPRTDPSLDDASLAVVEAKQLIVASATNVREVILKNSTGKDGSSK